ncbi:MAG: PhoH family protein, partial [Halothiobacillaceae bacterium]
MIHHERPRPCLFVLDTNVLIHDPTALFRFHEHDIYLPMVVLEELDRIKKGTSEIARNVRQASRFFADLMADADVTEIEAGLPITPPFQDAHLRGCTGRLYFQTRTLDAPLPQMLAGAKADNAILAVTLALMQQMPERQVVLVSKDINLRIKATALGIRAEDYENDQVLDDADLLYTGVTALPEDFWGTHSKDLHAWQEEGRSFYRIHGPLTGEWLINQFLYLEGDTPFEGMVRSFEPDGAAIVETITNYTLPKNTVWGITARNREQSFALNLLMNPEIDFVTLLGQAGTGKTLLTLAAALAQTLEKNLFSEIIMTRVTVPVGEDIGFLPGTEEEKMTPWMSIRRHTCPKSSGHPPAREGGTVLAPQTRRGRSGPAAFARARPRAVPRPPGALRAPRPAFLLHAPAPLSFSGGRKSRTLGFVGLRGPNPQRTLVRLRFGPLVLLAQGPILRPACCPPLRLGNMRKTVAQNDLGQQ